MKDLIVLVADKDMFMTVDALLQRWQALQIREIDYHVIQHAQHDAGCRTNAHNFLREYLSEYHYTLVLFDYAGCGAEGLPIDDLQIEVEEHLAANGWAERNAVVVIQPELEAWVWSASPRVDEILGWQGKIPDLRTWLTQQKHLSVGNAKPIDPKAALEATLRHARIPRSSAIYRQLAEKVSFAGCTDPSFQRFLAILQTWFPR